MENFENQNQEAELSPEEKLENFRDEIANAKEAEMEKKKEWEARGQKGEAYNAHFDIIDPEFLSESEMGIYEQFKKGDLNDKEFGSLRAESLSRFAGKDVEADLEYKSAHSFLMYLGNIINAQMLRKQLEKMKEKK